MRYGFTTGSCAAAAAKAAAYMLLTGKKKTEITIATPKGIPYHAVVEEIAVSQERVRCAVRKDGGDDPDITTGALVFASVCFLPEEKVSGQRIVITAGTGVGTVTKPGLNQPVGSAAINHVPREMIKKEVEEVCALVDYAGSLSVEISVPSGALLAEKTFNPRLGIVGGISILGTTGIVEPMSSQALIGTIRVELGQKQALGYKTVAVSPGNYGLDFMRQHYGFDLEESVKCSNFIGVTIDMANELGFAGMLLTGHIGKLVKLSGGIMNTHSREADGRMELLSAAAVRAGCDAAVSRRLLACVTTEEALGCLQEAGLLEESMQQLMEQIMYYLGKRAGDGLAVECILYANGYGELARSAGAKRLLADIKEMQCGML